MLLTALSSFAFTPGRTTSPSRRAAVTLSELDPKHLIRRLEVARFQGPRCFQCSPATVSRSLNVRRPSSVTVLA